MADPTTNWAVSLRDRSPRPSPSRTRTPPRRRSLASQLSNDAQAARLTDRPVTPERKRVWRRVLVKSSVHQFVELRRCSLLRGALMQWASLLPSRARLVADGHPMPETPSAAREALQQ